MAIPQKILEQVLPQISLSKINVEGQDNNITLTIEVENKTLLKISDSEQVQVGVAIIQTSEDISSINNLQTEFEQRVRNGFGYFSIKNNPKQQEKVVEENGKKFLSKTISTTAVLDIQENNLIIFYGSWIQNNDTGEFSFSRVKAEIIFEDGQLKSESYLYFIDGTEDIWEGNVLLADDGFSFTTDESTPRQLTRYKTKNYVVQDFRVRNIIEKSIQDYQELNNKLLNLKSKQIKTRKKNNKKYFTDSYISQKQNLSLIFGINFADLVLQNSFLGKDPNLSTEMSRQLFEKSKIVDLKIVKRRVLRTEYNSNSITDARNGFVQFPNSFEKRIASGRDKQGLFSGDENIKETSILIPSLHNKFRFFSCVDENVSSNKDCLYQYGVKIEIMDGSTKIIVDDISDLETSVLNAEIKRNDTMTETDIEKYVDTYLSKVRRYYSIGNVSELKKKLVSILSPVNHNFDALNNFINLQKTLISNLQNMIGEKATIYDDPHIKDDINTEKSTKNTFIVEHYFTNNVYDTSLADMKKVEYLPDRNTKFFNEYMFANLYFQNREQIERDSSAVPVSTLLSPMRIYHNTALKKIEGTELKQYGPSRQEQFYNTIKENLLKHVNIEVKKVLLNKTGFKEKEQEVIKSGYSMDSLEVYKYFSSTNVKDKEIDEVFDLYAEYQNDFNAKIEYLLYYNSSTGNETWDDLANLHKQTLLDEEGCIICRLNLKNDYRATKWNISDNIKALDTFFVLKVNNLQDMKNSFSSFYQIDVTPSVNFAVVEDAPQAPNNDTKDSKVVLEKIILRPEKVKKLSRNWILTYDQ